MIKIHIENKEYTLASEYSEITLSQLDSVMTAMAKEEEPLLQWAEIIHVLNGPSVDDILSWPLEDFVRIVNAMFTEPIEWYEEFVHNDIKYTRAKGSKLNARQAMVVQRAFTNSPTPMSHIMSTLVNAADPTTLVDLPANYAIAHLLSAGLRLVEDMKISTSI